MLAPAASNATPPTITLPLVITPADTTAVPGGGAPPPPLEPELPMSLQPLARQATAVARKAVFTLHSPGSQIRIPPAAMHTDGQS
jgi:hypothetical protein